MLSVIYKIDLLLKKVAAMLIPLNLQCNLEIKSNTENSFGNIEFFPLMVLLELNEESKNKRKWEQRWAGGKSSGVDDLGEVMKIITIHCMKFSINQWKH